LVGGVFVYTVTVFKSFSIESGALQPACSGHNCVYLFLISKKNKYLKTNCQKS